MLPHASKLITIIIILAYSVSAIVWLKAFRHILKKNVEMAFWAVVFGVVWFALGFAYYYHYFYLSSKVDDAEMWMNTMRAVALTMCNIKLSKLCAC